GQVGDLGLQRLPLPFQLQPVVAGQPAQRRVEDVLRLDGGQVEHRHEPVLGRGGVVAGPDDLDDLVDVEQRDHQAVDQVQPVGALAAAVLAAPAHDLDPVVDVDLQQVTQAAHLRLPVYPRDVVHAERLLPPRQ